MTIRDPDVGGDPRVSHTIENSPVADHHIIDGILRCARATSAAAFGPNVGGGSRQLLERCRSNGILAPRAEIEVPPLCLVDVESLRFHGMAQEIAMPPLQRCASG